MKYNQLINVIILMICLTLVSPLIQGTPEIEESFARWQILDWNDDIVVAWDWGVNSFETINGSYINYTLSHHESSNFTHPSAGSIIVGNLTTQTTNNKTAEVLVLSIWGWFPGLITSSNNWTLQEQVALSASQGTWTLGNLSVNEVSYDYQGDNREAIIFVYKQDSSIGNQNTTLIYDKETGVLLEGWTEICFAELYVLHLKLTETSIIDIETSITALPTTSSTTSTTSTTSNITDIKTSTDTPWFPLTIGLALILLGKKRKR